MSKKKSQSRKEKSKPQESSSHDKSIDINQQDKNIFERIAAGGKVSPNLKKYSLPSNLVPVKSGSHAHGHIMRLGDYRYSPGLQQIRLEAKYKEAQEVEKSQSQSSEKTASQFKDTNLAKASEKTTKLNENQSKSSSTPVKNTDLSSENKSTSSKKKISSKQVANSKTVDEKTKSNKVRKSNEQHK